MKKTARKFYEEEALRGGWSIRQLDRQIASQFYERTALSKNKTAMLTKGQKPRPEDAISPDEEIKDPFVLEFLNLKMSIPKATWKRPLFRSSNRSSLSSAATLPSSAASAATHR